MLMAIQARQQQQRSANVAQHAEALAVALRGCVSARA